MPRTGLERSLARPAAHMGQRHVIAPHFDLATPVARIPKPVVKA